MTTKPYAYQKKGVRKIQHFRGRALLADDMGLGKTFQSWLWRKRFQPGSKTVVVCPAVVKENWVREAAQHVGERVEALYGQKPPARRGRTHTLSDRTRAFIINYDILGAGRRGKSWLKLLRRWKPDLVIVDEIQNIKTRTAKRTKWVRELCRGVKHVVGLGGTAGVENCPAELFPFLNIVRPDIFDSFFAFAKEYCNPKRTPWGWDFRGSKNLDKLHPLLLRTCMIRRKKSDVLKDLPAKTRSVVPLLIPRLKEYKEAEKDIIRFLAKVSKKKARKAAKAEKLVKIGHLKRLAAELKLGQVVRWVEDFREANPGGKLLLFGVHKSVLRPVFERFKRSAVLVTGEVTGKKRQAAIDRFNTDPKCWLFVGNTQAAGVGWSCRSASTVVFCELDWTPGRHVQAEDRVYGLKRGVAGVPVTVYYLVAKGTIEEQLCRILQTKQKNLDAILDGGSSTSSFDIMAELERALLAGTSKTPSGRK